jgi:hypothetical protein
MQYQKKKKFRKYLKMNKGHSKECIYVYRTCHLYDIVEEKNERNKSESSYNMF